ncbi:alpha/beta fold hydrolase [Phenylobacterium sp.]|uniref:alpha/beta fold hydrolase n=1 Tax=Phenylobacterium sp. TaxID=1871053 RepID=UPI0035B166A2|nr:alpha/beta hydrolase [Pseudomonadota bacterium]
MHKRPKGVLSVGWACFASAASGRTEHVPTSDDYPDSVVRRFRFEAGGGLGWKISALATPRARPAPWKIVVVTGAPSWAEYWAPVLAQLPPDREMVVVDRPGYAGSEPVEYVGDIQVQARALAPLLQSRPGQKVLLVGQSYGAAIASIMAEQNPRRVAGLVMLSGYFGESGPTARWLVHLGTKLLKVIPRDLRHAVLEVSNQPGQLEHLHAALGRLRIPVHVIHGDKDDFAPIEIAERLAVQTASWKPIRFERVPGGDHFISNGPVEPLLASLEACIPVRRRWLPDLALLRRLTWPRLRLGGRTAQA